MILFWRARQKQSVSAVYNPIKIAEIVNTALSEWGICPFFRVVCAPYKKAGPPIKTGLEPPLQQTNY